jgi:hypothetical protein
VCYELCRRNLVDYALTGLVAEARSDAAPSEAVFNHYCGLRKSALERMRHHERKLP